MEGSAAVLPSLAEGPPRENVGDVERLASGLLGAVLIGWGISGLVHGRPVRGLAGSAAGAVLAARGLTGRSALYGGLGIEEGDAHRHSSPLSRQVHVRRSVTINRPADELYRRWRKFEDLPNVMRHLIRVEELEEGRSRWEARGPLDKPVRWEARITSDSPGRVIAWESLPGGDVETNGRVGFRALPGERGTIVRVDLAYRPPAGVFGAAAAKLLGADPATEIGEDLRRFKQLVETGEVATNLVRPEPQHDRRGEAAGRHTWGREAARGQQREGMTWPGRTDRVKEASMESFPASDAPGWIGARVQQRENA